MSGNSEAVESLQELASLIAEQEAQSRIVISNLKNKIFDLECQVTDLLSVISRK